jgi:hypothetical protein
MTKYRKVNFQRGIHWLLAVAAAVVALAAGMVATVPGGSAAASTASVPHKSAALARSQATGFAGLHGGKASGTAVGRSKVLRTARPLALTAAQLRVQRLAAQMPVLTPQHPQGTPVAHHPSRPTSAAVAAASAGRTGARASGHAPTDFNYFRAQNVAPGDFNSSTDEPSTANDGNDVLYTGNWYAAESTNSGHSFSYIDPYTLGPAPTLPNGGFCCDQATIHAAANGITAWGLLYCPTTCGSNPSGDNLIRLAVARNQSDLAAGLFDYYDFSAQSFGFPNGDWLDYPHLGANNGYLSLSMNVFNGGSFVASILVKFNLSSFLTGSWSANWVYANQDFTWTPTDNSTDSWTYWAATAYGNGGFIRVYNWPPNTDYTHVSWNNFSVGFNSETQNGSCPAPDANNWCAFDDSRVKTGGEVGVSTAYFMWDAAQGGGFNYPYVEYASFNVSTGPATSISAGQIWNPNYAWAYPGMGVNGRGALGVSLAIGGGTWGYPGSQFLIDDDVSGGWAAAFLDSGAHADNRWGDFLTARAATTGTSIGNTWIAAGYTLHDNGSGGAETWPSFYWLGRNRDDPFAPSWYHSYTNYDTEGIAASQYTGIFNGPSNCACDYSVTNAWGDGVTVVPSLNNYTPGYFALFGTHAYAEEGSYTTAMTATDNWGAAASGSGAAAVSDAALTAAGKTIYGLAKVPMTRAVATFTDADPGGTAADYTATIHWGDGTTSAGTISGHFTVSGTHTYPTTGTRTVTVTITDHAATATATGTAKIGNLPVITLVAPASGSHLGGTTVTITGGNFTGATSVKFGTTAAAFTVNTATKITAKAPAHAAGIVDVRVTTPYGTSVLTIHDRYKFT